MPDLVLLDYQLKDGDCTTYLEVVRGRWGGQGLKMIVVTGHARNPNLLRISQQVPVLQAADRSNVCADSGCAGGAAEVAAGWVLVEILETPRRLVRAQPTTRS